mmetsp:Transcript_31254/g.72887  ORF Transcript_31254/g.72887 Transcript_31254/m.72887 type:complete len:498 (-) Transcript_31254:158-1651(-)
MKEVNLLELVDELEVPWESSNRPSERPSERPSDRHRDQLALPISPKASEAQQVDKLRRSFRRSLTQKSVNSGCATRSGGPSDWRKGPRRLGSWTSLASNAVKQIQDPQKIVRPSLSITLPDEAQQNWERSHATPTGEFGVRLQMVNPEKFKWLMGSITRNFVSGETGMRDPNFAAESEMDFSVVDLYQRNGVAGTPKELARDAYLMKPMPMNYRTWMYHAYHNAGWLVDVDDRLREIGDGDGLVTHVLEKICIDVPIRAGRWSPVACLAPMAMALGLTADFVQVIICLLTLGLVSAVSKIMNTPDLYRYTRVVTFPLRIGFFVYLCATVSTSSLTVALGYLLAIMCAMTDLIMGDGGVFSGIKHECHYEVLRVLPTTRIFMCRRTGAASMSQHRRVPIEEGLTGMGAWESDMAMIADINGLLVELVPLTLDDWKHIEEKYVREKRLIQCLSLGVFCEKYKNIMELEDLLYGGDAPTMVEPIQAPNSGRAHHLALEDV